MPGFERANVVCGAPPLCVPNVMPETLTMHTHPMLCHPVAQRLRPCPSASVPAPKSPPTSAPALAATGAGCAASPGAHLPHQLVCWG